MMSGMCKENNFIAKNLLAEIFNKSIDEIKDDASIDSIEDWDSLAHIQVMTGLEKILGRPLGVDELIAAVNLKGIEMVIDTAKNRLP